MIDVGAKDLAIIRNILRKNVPFAEVRAFGSRVTGTTKKHSDLDLAVVAEKQLPSAVLSLLKVDFEESDLPFRVDVLDWQVISKKFQALLFGYLQFEAFGLGGVFVSLLDILIPAELS